VKDHIDLWYKFASASRKRPLVKKLAMLSARAVKAATGVVVTPTLSLAIRKVL